MKTFAFVSKNGFRSAYNSVLLKYKRQDTIWDIAKITLLILVFLISAIFYLRFVSLSSTRGYFLRQENQNLSNVSFKYEIIKTQLLEQKLKNRGVLDGDSTVREMIVVPINPVENSGVDVPVIKIEN